VHPRRPRRQLTRLEHARFALEAARRGVLARPGQAPGARRSAVPARGSPASQRRRGPAPSPSPTIRRWVIPFHPAFRVRIRR
jgi:hypothetical protein